MSYGASEQGSADPDGMQLTHLSTGAVVHAADVTDLYEHPFGADPTDVYVRANMITSLDGAATITGRSGELGGPNDRAIFTALRANADVILVGAGTAHSERYHGAHLTAALRQRRQARGQGEVPVIAVVTGSGSVDPTTPLFVESEVAPIVVTTTAGAANASRHVTGIELLIADAPGGKGVDMRSALAALKARGLPRVLCEGGPALLGSLLRADLVDELCVTTAPTTVAGGGNRIASSDEEALACWRRVLLLGDADGYLFTRHVRS